MAEESVKKIYNVEIQGTDALKTLADLKIQSQGLRDQQKALGQVTGENAEEYFKLGSQIKAVDREASAYQKHITNSIKLQNQQEESLERLRTQLSLDIAELAKYGNESEHAVRKAELQESVAATTEELKRQEEALGDHRRSVGDYEKANKSLRTELRELTEQLARMTANGQNTSKEYEELAARAAVLRDAQGDVNAQINRLASDTKVFDTVSEAVKGVTAAYGLWQAASALVGEDNKELQEVMQRMMVVMGALQSLTTIQNLLQKQSNIYMAASNLLQKVDNTLVLQSIKARAAQNATTAAGTIAQKAAAAATWLWNAALAANPIVAITIAIAALVAGVYALTSAIGSNTKAADAYADALDNVEAKTQKINEIRDLSIQKIELETKKLIEAAKARGASATELAAIELDSTTKITAAKAKALEDEIANSKELQKLNRKAAQEAEENFRLQVAGENYAGRRKLAKKFQETMAELNAEYDELSATIDSNTMALEANAIALQTATREATEQAAAAEKEANEKAEKEDADAIARMLEARLDASMQNQRIQEATLKAQAVYRSDDIKARQAHERALFKIQQDGERERLNARVRAGAITVDAYKDEVMLLEMASAQFYAKQADDLNKHYEAIRNNILRLAGRTAEEQIAELITTYTEAMKELGEIEPPRMAGMTDEQAKEAMDEYEAFLYRRAELETRLTKQLEEGIAAIRENALDTRIKKIEEAIKKEYKDDLEKYANNEAEKLRIQIASLEKQIAAKRAAGLTTYAEEAALQTALVAQNSLNMERDLALQGRTAEERYNIKRAALENERLLYADNADEQIRISQEIADAERELFDSRVEMFSMYAGAVGDMASALNDLLNALGEQRKQEIQENYDSDLAELDAQLKNKTISEEKYNKKKAELDAKKAKEEAKLAREQAIRERALALFNIAVNTAMGIMNAIGQLGPIAGAIMAGIVTAIGIAQTAAVLAQPLPKAAKGKYIRGKSHTSGGVAMEVEGGEAIINKRSSSMFLPLLSAINEMGGGVPFTTAGSDGGYAIRSAMNNGAGITASEMESAIESAFSKVVVVATIEDIRKADSNYAEIESRGIL